MRTFTLFHLGTQRSVGKIKAAKMNISDGIVCFYGETNDLIGVLPTSADILIYDAEVSAPGTLITMPALDAAKEPCTK